MPAVLYALGLVGSLAAGTAYLLLRGAGDSDIALVLGEAHSFSLSVAEGGAAAYCRVPLTNRGGRAGTVAELLCEPRVPGGGPGPEINTFVREVGGGALPVPLVVPAGRALTLEVGAAIPVPSGSGPGDPAAYLRGFPGLSLAFRYKSVSRRSVVCRRSVLALPWEAMLQAAGC
jgi:hypothetical protein